MAPATIATGKNASWLLTRRRRHGRGGAEGPSSPLRAAADREALPAAAEAIDDIGDLHVRAPHDDARDPRRTTDGALRAYGVAGPDLEG